MSEQPTEIGGVSITYFKVCAVIAGVLAIIGIGTSIYAFISTPGIYQISFYVDGRLQGTTNKIFYFFSGPLFQVVVFAAATQPIRKWKQYAEKHRDVGIPYDILGTSGVMNSMKIMQITIAGGCVVSALFLWTTVSRAIIALSHT